MQCLKNSVLSLTIAILVCPLSTFSQLQEPPATSRSEQQQGPAKPTRKFVKGTKNRIPNRYIVVLKDDVVSSDAPLEVRRARVTAIAKRHAQTYGGKFDYIYETALKGYAIELPNEAAAIAISELPEVKWVEADLYATVDVGNQIPEPLTTPELVCRGKAVAVSLLARPYGMELSGPRTSYLQGGISQRARLVIRDRDKFKELWDQITRATSDKPPLPEVDFSREMIIVAAMGGPQSSRNEIIIDSACEVDNQLEVMIRSTKFLPCGLQAGLPPETVDIVRLPKTDLPVVFKEIEVTVDC